MFSCITNRSKKSGHLINFGELACLTTNINQLMYVVNLICYGGERLQSNGFSFFFSVTVHKYVVSFDGTDTCRQEHTSWWTHIESTVETYIIINDIYILNI